MPFGNPELERMAIESTYDGICTVTEFQQVKDPVTKVTKQKQVVVLKDRPCALSQVTLASARSGDTNNEIDYDAKLFISPDITIKAGSRIRVVQDGMDYEFEETGEPFRYPTHQEIKLKRVDRA
ncbi:hypothetical protein ABH14_10010 [Brevibacillus brevis]|uniref:ABC transporter ATP-binding protein n=1 Tax=Brevibacillus brevis TaxID=1393 RepID=UPI001901A1ED|nr:ABC transporter ATP-binding protein [Brevibacillus brevis]MBH0330124.1 hypothetical protein [Brevibacillus brevis]